MELFACQVGFACIGNLDQIIRKAGKKKLQKKAPGKMLQPFMRMGNVPVLGDRAFEEFFGFLDLPYPKAGGITDSMLKKIRHYKQFYLEDTRLCRMKALASTNFRFKIADL